MMKKSINLEALTLVETVIYMALFSFIMIMVMQFFFIVDKSNDSGMVKNDLEKSVMFVTGHLQESFGSSTGINQIDSVINNSNGVLALEHNGTPIRYLVDQEKIQVTRGTEVNYITSDDFRVSEFRLEPIYLTDNSLEGLKIYIKLESKKDNTISRSFSSYYKPKI